MLKKTFLTALFITAKNWKHLPRLTVEEWLSKLWHSY